MSKMDVKLKKCTTPEFQVSFPSVFEAKAFNDQAPKFSVVMLFPKKTDLKELHRAYKNAAIEAWGENEKKWPKHKTPFKDGNEKPDLMGYPNTVYLNATSKTKPGLVDQALETITAEDIGADGNPRFYAGCYARATLIAFAYGKPKEGIPYGVSFSLQNIQKLRDGKPFSGKKAAKDEFEAVEDESNTEAAYGSQDSADAETDESDTGF